VAVPMQSLYDSDRVYRVENNRLSGISVTRVGDYIDEHGQFRVLVRSQELKPGDTLMITQLPVAITGLLVSPVALLHDQADA
jgi:HlyD family secretion protein